MGSIRPTTTPTIYVEIEGADLTDWKNEVTIQNKHVKLVLRADRLNVSLEDNDSTLITTTLTADETRALTPGSQAKVQLRYEKDGDRHATTIGSISVDEILNYEEM